MTIMSQAGSKATRPTFYGIGSVGGMIFYHNNH